jgi:UDP-N-acetyl-D-mannosaminuronic acid transferase (WecB/TagA/CpsF family)
MPKYTVREFAKSLGLETKGTDYVAMGVVLKLLCDKGIAKEVERINTSVRGRKSVVYEVPETIVLEVPPVATVEEVAETPETVETEVVVETVETEVVVETPETVETEVVETQMVVEERGYYDDDEEEDLAA